MFLDSHEDLKIFCGVSRTFEFLIISLNFLVVFLRRGCSWSRKNIINSHHMNEKLIKQLFNMVFKPRICVLFAKLYRGSHLSPQLCPNYSNVSNISNFGMTTLFSSQAILSNTLESKNFHVFQLTRS